MAALTFEEVLQTENSTEVLKFNPFHDARGRFSSSNGYAAPSYQTIDQNKASTMSKKMLSDAERSALMRETNYFGTKNSFKINQAIRTGQTDQLTQEDRKTIKMMDASMRPLPDNVTLTRKADVKFLEALGISGKMSQDEMNKRVAGGVVTEKSYMSTAYDPANLAGTMKKRSVTLSLKAPKGTKALIRPDQRESEIVLARNTSYRINRVRVTDSGDIEIRATVL